MGRVDALDQKRNFVAQALTDGRMAQSLGDICQRFEAMYQVLFSRQLATVFRRGRSRLEVERSRVDAIAETGGLGAVVESVTEVSFAAVAENLCTRGE